MKGGWSMVGQELIEGEVGREFSDVLSHPNAEAVASNIMAQACLPTPLVDNGVHKAIHDDIVEAVEAAYRAGWNAAMGNGS
jgi:hypothetical protein